MVVLREYIYIFMKVVVFGESFRVVSGKGRFRFLFIEKNRYAFYSYNY